MLRRKYLGVNAHRVKYYPEEKRFADAWLEQGGQTLPHILNPDPSSKPPPEPSERDEVVAATVVQWLGSPIGQVFLSSLGYIDRKMIAPVLRRAHEQATTKLTAAQRKWLARADARGVIAWIGTRGLAESNWRKVMERLTEMGLVEPYVHGGFELTAAGRRVEHDHA